MAGLGEQPIRLYRIDERFGGSWRRALGGECRRLLRHAPAETIGGLYKVAVIHRRGPWRPFTSSISTMQILPNAVTNLTYCPMLSAMKDRLPKCFDSSAGKP